MSDSTWTPPHRALGMGRLERQVSPWGLRHRVARGYTVSQATRQDWEQEWDLVFQTPDLEAGLGRA